MIGRHIQTLIAVTLAAIFGFGVYFEHSRGGLRFLDRIESTAIDIRTLARGKKEPPDLVTIVAIDDAVVKSRGTYPLPRIEIAKIIDAIAQLEPKVIAIDLLLVDNGVPEADEALAKSLAARPAVIAAAAIFPEASQSVSSEDNKDPLAGLPTAEKFLLPLKKFTDHAKIGIANVATDQAGTPRSIPMLFRTGDMVELSFPLRVDRRRPCPAHCVLRPTADDPNDQCGVGT
jgi:adenylate cyclase